MKHANLTPRQRDVLRTLLEGRTHAAVAQRLGIALSTVRFHVRNTHEKTGTHSMTELIRWAMEHRACCLDVPDEQA